MAANSSAGVVYANCGIKYFLAGNLVAYVCALPIFLSVILVGFQRWRRRRRSRSASSPTSNVDVIAYNMVAVELMGISVVCLYIYTLQTSRYAFTMVVTYAWVLVSCAPVLFLILTCADCYLAVLHPVVYLRLRSTTGVWIRKAVVALVWLLSLVFGILRSVFSHGNVMYLVLVVLALVAVLYCCTAVVRALIRPKPGDGGGPGESIDPTKKRAFNTMVAIVAALLTRFSLNLLTELLGTGGWSQQVCLANMISISFHLPSSLVLPLLFLQRARKLPFCNATVAAA
ncbi:unnamed protein product [Ophioblennius macclurei]